MQPPQGPVFLSIPLDDWNREARAPIAIRNVATRVAPDPERADEFAERLNASSNPALVVGSDIDRSGGWAAAIELAEKIKGPVFMAPLSERANFPEDHPQFAGPLMFAIAPLHDQLAGHDLVLVVGAPVFRYYPYAAGEFLPEGCSLLHVTDDPEESARAPVGDSMISDARLALEALNSRVDIAGRVAYRRAVTPVLLETVRAEAPEALTADELYAAVASVRPDDAIVVTEAPSTFPKIRKHLPITKPLSYFTLCKRRSRLRPAGKRRHRTGGA